MACYRRWLVGDEWAEHHHDVAVSDGRILQTARLPESMDGITRFHDLVAAHLPGGADAPEHVIVYIEIDRGPWVRALVATGYQVYGVNPKQAVRHRETMSLSVCQERQRRRAHAGRHGPRVAERSARGPVTSGFVAV